jgi:RNA polymerase sigma factor (sigma-70 family)
VVTLSGREPGRQIIESCRSGDRDAFRVLYELHKDRVYSIAFYFFNGDREAASDVTQQVFLKLMTSIGQFRGDSDFSTWLYRLVVNACMDAARVRKSEHADFEMFAAPPTHEHDYAGISTPSSRGVDLLHADSI